MATDSGVTTSIPEILVAFGIGVRREHYVNSTICVYCIARGRGGVSPSPREKMQSAGFNGPRGCALNMILLN